MMMRYDLVVGGALLLCCAMAAKLVWDLHTLPRLVVCLNLLWSMFVAFHTWPLFAAWTTHISLEWDGFPVDAASFWLAFLVAALPGTLIYRWTVRDAPVDFPTFFDWFSGFAFTAVGVWLVPCLIIMTVSIGPAAARSVLPEEGVAGRVVVAMRAAPLQLYLGAAEAVGREQREALLATRIPAALRDQVFPRPPSRPAKRR